jgi:hypothetical protein
MRVLEGRLQGLGCCPEVPVSGWRFERLQGGRHKISSTIRSEHKPMHATPGGLTRDSAQELGGDARLKSGTRGPTRVLGYVPIVHLTPPHTKPWVRQHLLFRLGGPWWLRAPANRQPGKNAGACCHPPLELMRHGKQCSSRHHNVRTAFLLLLCLASIRPSWLVCSLKNAGPHTRALS